VLTKEEVRRTIRRKRRLLSEEECAEKSKAIADRLVPILSNAESILFYAPVFGEVNLMPLAVSSMAGRKVVAFPKVAGDEILPVAVESVAELIPGYRGIPEPPLNRSRVLERVDVAVVPGVAFDLECYRVGWGKGFYDRFLSKWKVGVKVGVCFEFQVFDRLPREHFDVPVDFVVTEKRTFGRRSWS